MAIPAASLVLSPAPITTQRTVGEIDREFNEKLVASIRSVAANNKDCLSRKDDERVLSGVWYPNEYLDALRNTKRAEVRLRHLTNKGAFYHGWANPKFFDRIPSRNSLTGFAISNFISRQGIDPSDALQALRDGLSMIGCGEACMVAMHESLREILGKEKYNALFPRLVITWDCGTTPIQSLLFTRVTESATLPAGALVRISNVAQYTMKHLMGEAAGFNLIATGDGRFVGLGTPPGGLSHQETNQLLLDEFNKPPLDMGMVTPELGSAILLTYTPEDLRFVHSLSTVRIDTLSTFQKQGGGEMHVYGKVNTARVTELANRTIAEGQALLAQWRTLRPSSS